VGDGATWREEERKSGRVGEWANGWQGDWRLRGFARGRKGERENGGMGDSEFMNFGARSLEQGAMKRQLSDGATERQDKLRLCDLATWCLCEREKG
jgi:hypothetical protein